MKIKEKIKMVVSELKSVDKDKLQKILGISKKDKRKFNKTLDQMVSEGTIHMDQRGNVKIGPAKVYKGTFMATRQNYGFIENKDGDDYFVPAGKTMGAMDRDIVEYEIVGKERGREIAFVRDVDFTNKSLVGMAIKRRKKLIIQAERELSYPIKILNYDEYSLREGGLYRVEIISFDEGRGVYRAKIKEFIGFKGEKHVDLMSLVVDASVPATFTDEVLREADEVSKEAIVPKARKDYRDLLTVTIDGKDAKDFDDAISIDVDGNSYILTVHIADVSHYVKSYSKLDHECYNRQMSIYLPGLVIPMLPEVISNGVCSLNPNEDRYAMSVRMKVDKSGNAELISIDKSIIESDYRLNYEDLNKFYDGESIEPYNSIGDFFNACKDLYEILKKASVKRGTIEFMSLEPEIATDDKGKVTDIKVRDRGLSERIIEEFMIITNKMVATKYFVKMFPFLYRVHEAPTDEKIATLRTLLRPYGLKVEDDMDAKKFQELLERAKDMDAYERINDLVLRSMTKADYRDENEGHFALALENYSHFTAPIRRYPDLFIHRIMSMDMEGKLSKKNISIFEDQAKEIGERATSVERVVLDLERDAIQLKKCEYMKEKIGEVYPAKISGVVEFGIFAMLDNTVEGLIHADYIENYRFDEKTMTARAKNFDGDLEVGKRVYVKVVNVSVSRMQIDFEFVGEDEYGKNSSDQ
ncbi:ribonuclease R [uncultured Ezakiella sp.]|uniref:ribonuclease R n=1 Tax=uncultured Ezakiella sp. TaxID=1637529 RepID=UPI0025F6EC41|nr:ribonuclease R [uncultured Ezakiella sp.]